MMAIAPLSSIPLIVYMAVALVWPSQAASGLGAEPSASIWGAAIFTAHLVSGRTWILSSGDLIVAFATILLLVSVLRTAGRLPTTVPAIMATVLALCVHVVLFLTVGAAGTSTFFLLTVVALVDALATISLALVVRPGAAQTSGT